MNMVPQEPMARELEDVAERAERGRAFYFMFPGSDISDRWLSDFEKAETPAHRGNGPRASADDRSASSNRESR